MFNKKRGGKSKTEMDPKEEEMNRRKIMKKIEFVGSRGQNQSSMKQWTYNREPSSLSFPSRSVPRIMYSKKKGGKSKTEMDPKDEEMDPKDKKMDPKDEDMDPKDEEMDIRKIMKDIEFLGSAHMTWKERKELENRKVVSLGGKPPKKQRLPLSVSRVMMKKQKEREEKTLQESLILGRFGGKNSNNAKSTMTRRRPEDRVLKATEGHFRNGVLDVKHLLRPGSSRDSVGPSRNFDASNIFADKGPKKGSGKKSGGKKKGGGKKRH